MTVAGSGRTARSALLLSAVAVACLAGVASWVRARGADPLAGYGMPAPSSPWMLVAAPVLRLAVTTTGGVCLGLLVGIVVARRSAAAGGGPRHDRALSWAGVAAVVWAATASLAAVLLLVVRLGLGGMQTLARPGAALEAMVTFGEPAAMLLTAVAGVVVATLLATTDRPAGGAVVWAALGVLAPAVCAPITSTGIDHDLVSDIAVLAAPAAAVWLGATVLQLAEDLPRPRYVVGAAVVTVLATAVGETVLVRGRWWSDLHARWAVLQLALLGLALVLVVRRVRPVVVAAVLLVAAAAGAAAAVEPPPLRLLPSTMQQMSVGFDLPAAPTAIGLLLPGRLDLFWAVVGVVLATAYLVAWRRLVRRGESWPPTRLVCWLAGCAALVWVTSSTLGSLAMAVFSAHTAVHAVLVGVVPALWVTGGPLTLLLRALPAGGPARAWLCSAVDGRVLRLATHPLVSLAVLVVPMLLLYFTPLFGAVLPSHWAHQLMYAIVLVAGSLFLWPIVGVDPVPRPLPHVARLVLLLASMPFHAVVGIALIGLTDVVGGAYYRRLEVTWVPDLSADQRLGGLVAWVAGEVPMLAVLVIVLLRWGRADRGVTAGGDDETAAWDAMLGDLSDRRRERDGPSVHA